MRSAFIALMFGVAACSNQATTEASEYAKRFSLPPIDAPELRIWMRGYESGQILGYVVHRDEMTIYSASAFAPEVESRTINTYAANELIRMIPQLRRARVERCQLVMDGGRVTLEGADQNGRFVFAADNHEYCEGYNLHVLNQALEIAGTTARQD